MLSRERPTAAPSWTGKRAEHAIGFYFLSIVVGEVTVVRRWILCVKFSVLGDAIGVAPGRSSDHLGNTLLNREKPGSCPAQLSCILSALAFEAVAGAPVMDAIATCRTWLVVHGALSDRLACHDCQSVPGTAVSLACLHPRAVLLARRNLRQQWRDAEYGAVCASSWRDL